MRKPEAERKARMRAGADQAIAEEPSAVFPDLPDDVVIPPLGDQQQGLMLLDLDDEMQWLPRRFQEQLIESAMDWDDPALAVMDPESRRRNLFAELSGWHASLTQ